MAPDKEYQKWEQTTKTHKFTALALRVVGTLMSFKLSRALFCKYYGFKFFKAKLTSVDVLLPFNILMGISIFITSLPIIVSSCNLVILLTKLSSLHSLQPQPRPVVYFFHRHPGTYRSNGNLHDLRDSKTRRLLPGSPAHGRHQLLNKLRKLLGDDSRK